MNEAELLSYNRDAWNHAVAQDDIWTLPVNPE